MRIAQLSDLHLRDGRLYSGVDPWQALQAALARVAALQPAVDLLLLTGDLADDGQAATYARLARHLRDSGLPHVVLPGNHDDPTRLGAAFRESPWGRAPGWRYPLPECTLLMLDTSVPGEEWGDIGVRHLDWLTQQALPAGQRALLALHHPPLALGIPGMDAIASRGGPGLASWLAAQPSIELVLCGHVHRHVTTLFAGQVLHTAPALVHQIALHPGGLAWTPEPGGFLLHETAPGQPWRTHYLPVEAAPVVPYVD